MANFAFRKSVTNNIFSEYHENRKENISWQGYRKLDFVANKGNQRYYIQSAYRLDSEEKVIQEQNSLRNVDDSFKKIVIVGNPILVERDNNGITTMSVYDFLLKENSLEL